MARASRRQRLPASTGCSLVAQAAAAAAAHLGGHGLGLIGGGGGSGLRLGKREHQVAVTVHVVHARRGRPELGCAHPGQRVGSLQHSGPGGQLMGGVAGRGWQKSQQAGLPHFHARLPLRHAVCGVPQAPPSPEGRAGPSCRPAPPPGSAARASECCSWGRPAAGKEACGRVSLGEVGVGLWCGVGVGCGGGRAGGGHGTVLSA